MADIQKSEILDKLSTVRDPQSGQDLVSAGRIGNIIIKGGNIGFAIDIGGATPEEMEPLRVAAESAVREIDGVLSASVMLTSERDAPPPPPPPSAGNGGHSHGGPSHGGNGPIVLPTVKTIIAVASGKGGVGKSTVAVNLALGMKALGKEVGLLDGDIYGPSLPRMLGNHTIKPEADEQQKIKPMEAWGIKAMSIGYLVKEETAMVWRGPMVAGALAQLFTDVNWGELDVLVVDMPPGTGDAQLTLAQRVDVTGAVIVSTPQDIALIDARKGIEMFQKVEVPILGIVENMAVFHCPKCGEASHIFGADGAKETAKDLNVDLLGEIPLHMNIREKADSGKPIVATDPDSDEAKAFIRVAENVIKALKI